MASFTINDLPVQDPPDAPADTNIVVYTFSPWPVFPRGDVIDGSCYPCPDVVPGGALIGQMWPRGGP